MKGIASCCFLVTIFGISQGLPGKYGLYYPKRSMMFGSYYSNPMEGYDYVPQGQMTAMVSGDTVATNTFSGQPWRAPPPVIQVPNYSAEEIPDDQPSAEHITEKAEKQDRPLCCGQHPNYTENEADSEFESEVETSDNKSQETEPASSSEIAEVVTEEQVVVSTSTKAPKVIPSKKIGSKRKAKKPVKQEEEQDEDEDLAPVWPFGGSSSRRGSGLAPGYNTFFPIFIGGSSASGRSRTRQSGAIEEDEMPIMPSGSATAIANAFSTGKGGVATSHATSFGDPMAAAFLRNSGYFGDYEAFVRRNKNKKNASEE